MRPQQGSRSDAVLGGLIEMLGSRLDDAGRRDGLSGVQILDGPIIGSVTYKDDVLSVGAGTPDDPGFTVRRVAQPGLGRMAYVEETEVTLIISCYSGDTDMKKRRARATAVFDAVKARIDAHQVTPGYWDQLRLGDQEAWHPVQSKQGCYVAVGFTIVAESIG